MWLSGKNNEKVELIKKEKIVISVKDENTYSEFADIIKDYACETIYMGNKFKEAFAKADEIFKAGDVVLVKASRGMEFEQIIEKLW